MSSTKVAVVGCGALGLNYGTRLLEAQLINNKPLDVSLVLRRDYDLVSRQGLRVEYGKANEEKRILTFSADMLIEGNFVFSHDGPCGSKRTDGLGDCLLQKLLH